MSIARPYGGVSAEDRIAGRRTDLLRCALDLIGREGVAAVTVEAVCAEAGLGKRYFYESFKVRDDLLAALGEDFFSGVIAEMREAIGDLPRDQRPAVVIATLVRILEDDPRLARLYVESPGVPVLAARRHQAIADYADFLADEVLPVEPVDEAERERLVLATRVVVAGTTDLVSSWLAGEVPSSRDALVEAIGAVGAGVVGSFSPR